MLSVLTTCTASPLRRRWYVTAWSSRTRWWRPDAQSCLLLQCAVWRLPMLTLGARLKATRNRLPTVVNRSSRSNNNHSSRRSSRQAISRRLIARWQAHVAESVLWSRCTGAGLRFCLKFSPYLDCKIPTSVDEEKKRFLPQCSYGYSTMQLRNVMWPLFMYSECIDYWTQGRDVFVKFWLGGGLFSLCTGSEAVEGPGLPRPPPPPSGDQGLLLLKIFGKLFYFIFIIFCWRKQFLK